LTGFVICKKILKNRGNKDKLLNNVSEILELILEIFRVLLYKIICVKNKLIMCGGSDVWKMRHSVTGY